MNKISVSEIWKRASALKSQNESSTNLNIKALYERSLENYNPVNVVIVGKNWKDLDPNTNMAFTQLMELFDIACANGSIGTIKSLANIIVEDAVPKVRDANQMQTFIKRRQGHVKTKISTKINNKIEDMKNAVQNSLPDSLKLSTTSTPDTSVPTATDNTVAECMVRIQEAVNTCLQCDRVLLNHSKLSKRYNIDSFVRESINTEDSISDCIVELCSFIDTYDMPFKVKYNVALENILYVLNKNGIICEKSEIINTATDYFLLTRPINESDIKKESTMLQDVTAVIKNSKFYTDSDAEGIDYIIAKAKEAEYGKDDVFGQVFDSDDNTYGVNDLMSSSFSENVTSVLEGSKTNKAKEILNSFKLQKIKTPEAFKAVIKKIYTCPADDIISETTNVFQLLFMAGVIVGTLAISPILAIIAGATNAFISMHLQRKETLKMITIYKKQRQKANTKLNNLKSDSGKDRCKAFIKQLDSDISKLEDYYDNLLSETEKDEMRNESVIEECMDAAVDINVIAAAVDGVKDWDITNMMNSIDENIDKLGLEDIDSLTEFACSFPGFIPSDKLLSIYEYSLKETRKIPGSKKYVKVDCLNENIAKLKRYRELPISEDIDLLCYNLNDMSMYTSAIKEAMHRCEDNQSIVLEMDFKNTINLMIERLKKTASNLSDKEQIMSRTVDGSLETLKNNMEKSVSKENREAVIRGSILPPASKVIKLAITSGITWMINPAIAIIGLIGAYVTSNRLKAKERQIILDELEVELVMVEKYIKLAEDKNNMKTMRELLTIQKKLERQKSRLKYKMNVEWNQKTPNGTDDRD